MAESMDMAFDNAETDQEADSVYNQICEEQGIAMIGEANDIGKGVIPNPGAQQAVANDNEVDDLQRRLQELDKWIQR